MMKVIGAGAGTLTAIAAVVSVPTVQAQVDQAGPAPSTPAPSPTASASTVTPTITPTTVSPTPDPTPLGSTPTTWRSTKGKSPLTLSLGYGADIDSKNPAWDVEYAAREQRFDLQLGTVDLGPYVKSDLAVVSGRAAYETCSDATGYTKNGIRRREAKPGMSFCLRTSEKRLAFITIKKLSPQDLPTQIQLDVTVWDPPFEE
jgi:hypothetical protein